MFSFAENLKQGQAAESLIGRWLRSRGNTVIPIYEKVINSGKGPQLFLPNDELIAPDLLVVTKGKKVQWIEVKQKTAFTWYRKDQCWETGIDLRHYEDYLRVDSESPWPVVLLFLHLGGQAKDSPEESPSGLFAGHLRTLADCYNHKTALYGSGGMIYWRIESLDLIATLEEVTGVLTIPENSSKPP